MGHTVTAEQPRCEQLPMMCGPYRPCTEGYGCVLVPPMNEPRCLPAVDSGPHPGFENSRPRTLIVRGQRGQTCDRSRPCAEGLECLNFGAGYHCYQPVDGPNDYGHRTI